MITLDRLLASALGDLDSEAEEEVEEHILSCGACARTYTSLLRLGSATAEIVRDGGASMPLTPSLLDALDTAGLISRRYLLEPGSVVPCTVGADDVYALVTLEVDLGGVARVDLQQGSERLADVPFDAATGRIHTATRSDFLRTLPTMRLPLTLLAVDEDGSERTLGEFVLDHTGFTAD